MSSEGQETQDAIKQPVTFQEEDRSFTKKNTVSTDVDVDHSELWRNKHAFESSRSCASHILPKVMKMEDISLLN